MVALPPDFLFGVSTASYQIEGAVSEDGRGRSVWDDFCDTPGTILDGSSGAVACDSYHRLGEDVAAMVDLGVEAYRFSIAWPRVIPEGRGSVNQAGLDYYDRLVDALCEKGIKPCPTLFHWDLPSPLEAAGGWTERATAEAFGEYAAVVAARLADRVAMWFPVNEPNVVTFLGYAFGTHAPGRQLGVGAIPVAHHLLLGHGLAVAALRAAGAAAVGSANNHSPIWAASQSPEDTAAASLADAVYNRLYADPILLGTYPEILAGLLPPTAADDLPTISAPLDFYGFNYYNPTLVAATPGDDHGAPTAFASGMPFHIRSVEGYPRTEFDWPVVPDGLREIAVQLTQRYADRLPPMYVTENGCCYNTGPDETGRVADAERIAFLDSHLAALAAAREQGAPLAGYFCWSLMDNFEWAEGYTKRFGLVHVDFDTLVRTPKDSFGWYRDLIASVRAS
ncbi:MAG: beta-glucosidase [Tetrasphaera sp.]|nr:beta-glucosidase [Tetrasphaera sp.]